MHLLLFLVQEGAIRALYYVRDKKPFPLSIPIEGGGWRRREMAFFSYLRLHPKVGGGGGAFFRKKERSRLYFPP